MCIKKLETVHRFCILFSGALLPDRHRSSPLFAIPRPVVVTLDPFYYYISETTR